jgi:hypothetical protein
MPASTLVSLHLKRFAFLARGSKTFKHVTGLDVIPIRSHYLFTKYGPSVGQEAKD